MDRQWDRHTNKLIHTVRQAVRQWDRQTDRFSWHDGSVIRGEQGWLGVLLSVMLQKGTQGLFSTPTAADGNQLCRTCFTFQQHLCGPSHNSWSRQTEPTKFSYKIIAPIQHSNSLKLYNALNILSVEDLLFHSMDYFFIESCACSVMMESCMLGVVVFLLSVSCSMLPGCSFFHEQNLNGETKWICKADLFTGLFSCFFKTSSMSKGLSIWAALCENSCVGPGAGPMLCTRWFTNGKLDSPLHTHGRSRETLVK